MDIVLKLIKGKTLTQIIKEGIITEVTLHHWLAISPSFKKTIKKAKQMRAVTLSEAVLEEAMKSKNLALKEKIVAKHAGLENEDYNQKRLAPAININSPQQTIIMDPFSKQTETDLDDYRATEEKDIEYDMKQKELEKKQEEMMKEGSDAG